MRILDSEEKDFCSFMKKFHHRGVQSFEQVEGPVRRILKEIRRRGDVALVSLTRRLDGWKATPRNLAISQREIQSALRSLSPMDRKTLIHAASRIERFHLLQKQDSWLFADDAGNLLGQIIRPLERVGIYVPGGKAAYPSSVLMNAIPAKVAGVSEIVMACPAPQGEIHPAVLAAASICGIKNIFRIGGAQAIGAMAYGTSLIPKVDKIVGPGNVYVAAAKRLVAGEVGIDSIAGPSEIVILSDGTGDPRFLAADLLAQAEHDQRAAAVLICTDREFGERVDQEIRTQLHLLPRKEIAKKSLMNFGAILVVRNMAEAVEIANGFAPEHLELAVSNPLKILKKIKNAGAVFLGHFSPEAIGDYVAGPNHVLPTGGAARFSSPLGVYDFLKRSSMICLSPKGFQNLSRPGMRLAEMEGLQAHRASIAIRTAISFGSP